MISNKALRLSLPALKVLNALLEAPPEGLAGSQIAGTTRVASGTLYPILARLEQAGWVESQWENIDPHEAGRPRRRYYFLTGVGAQRAAAALSEVAPGKSRSSAIAGPVWG